MPFIQEILVKKKILLLFTLFILLISLIPTNIVLAVENATYSEHNSKSEAMTVSTFGANVFANSTLTGITIPNGVDTIDSWSFHNCTLLTKFTIPSKVTNHGNNAFNRCSTLGKIIILNKSLGLLGCIAYTNFDAAGIYGFSGSAAQTCANTYGIPFHYLYTINFDTTAIEDRIIVDGNPLTKPADPTKSI